MRKHIRTVETIEMDGGWLCLDFINTIRHRFETPRHDYLENYGQFISWVLRKKLISREEAVRLRQEEGTPEAALAHQTCLEARETLYRLFRSLIHQTQPDPAVLTRFNEHLRTVGGSLKISIDPSRNIREAWLPKPDSLEYPLYPIIKSAYDLLLSDWLERVKECPACGWLFLDKSKNGSRRWCSMQTCGSSAKSKRYYNKSKKEDD